VPSSFKRRLAGETAPQTNAGYIQPKEVEDAAKAALTKRVSAMKFGFRLRQTHVIDPADTMAENPTRPHRAGLRGLQQAGQGAARHKKGGHNGG